MFSYYTLLQIRSHSLKGTRCDFARVIAVTWYSCCILILKVGSLLEAVNSSSNSLLRKCSTPTGSFQDIINHFPHLAYLAKVKRDWPTTIQCNVYLQHDTNKKELFDCALKKMANHVYPSIYLKHRLHYLRRKSSVKLTWISYIGRECPCMSRQITEFLCIYSGTSK